jgi:hypothetical protein
MAVNVASRRKRGLDAFLDDPLALPSDPAPLGKRGRCSPSSAAVAELGLSFPLDFDPVEALRLIFPDSDPQVRRPCASINKSLRFNKVLQDEACCKKILNPSEELSSHNSIFSHTKFKRARDQELCHSRPNGT